MSGTTDKDAAGTAGVGEERAAVPCSAEAVAGAAISLLERQPIQCLFI